MVSVITPDPMVLELRRRIGESSTLEAGVENVPGGVKCRQ
jgi:hypothetical protein